MKLVLLKRIKVHIGESSDNFGLHNVRKPRKKSFLLWNDCAIMSSISKLSDKCKGENLYGRRLWC